MNINSVKGQTIIIKAIHFMTYSAMASWLTYFFIYLKQEPRLTGFEIGAIAALQQINTVFVLPIWGMMADKYGRRKMYMIAIFATSICILGFMIPGNFWYYLAFMFLFTLINNPIGSLLDSISLDFQEQTGTVTYGEVRLWASIGWALSSALTGLFINADNIHLIFVLTSSQLLITFIITRFLYRPLLVTKNLKTLKINVISGLLKVNDQLRSFLWMVLAYALFMSPTMLFINMYYNEIGLNNKEIGIIYAVQSIVELPFFFYGKKIITRWGSRPIIIVAMGVTMIRLFVLAHIGSFWPAIAIGTFHGIGLALFYVAMIDYVQSLVPTELRATGQSLIYTFFGAGVCLGNLFTGYMKDIITIKTSLNINAVMILIIIIYLIAVKHYNKKTPLLE